MIGDGPQVNAMEDGVRRFVQESHAQLVSPIGLQLRWKEGVVYELEEQRTLGESLQERSVPTVPIPNILVRKQNESPRSSGSYTIVVKPGSL